MASHERRESSFSEADLVLCLSSLSLSLPGTLGFLLVFFLPVTAHGPCLKDPAKVTIWREGNQLDPTQYIYTRLL